MRLGDLREIAEYADAIGIAKSLATTEAVIAAHALRVTVHVWTFRAENEFLPDDLKIGEEAGRPWGSGRGNRTLSAARHRRLVHRLSGHRRARARPIFRPSSPCTSR